MVVDRDGEDLLRPVLADHVLVELLVELASGWECASAMARARRGSRLLFFDDLTAELDAFVADVDRDWVRRSVGGPLPDPYHKTNNDNAPAHLALIVTRAPVLSPAPRYPKHCGLVTRRLATSPSDLLLFAVGPDGHSQFMHWLEHLVDETIIPSFWGGHEVIALGVSLHLLERLPAMLGKDLG